MAIDTADKRASAGAIGPIPLSFPVPDADVSAADRKEMAALYRIPDGGTPPPPVVIYFPPPSVRRRRRRGRRVSTMMRKIFDYPIALTGAQTLNVNFEPYDLTRSEEIVSELIITSAAAAAGDTLDVRFQETEDGVQWNTRIRHTTQLGNSGATALAPISQRIILLKWPALAADQVTTPTGSAGASDLASGTVRHGPLEGRRPNRAPSYRYQFVVTSASAPVFAGQLIMSVDSDV